MGGNADRMSLVVLDNDDKSVENSYGDSQLSIQNHGPRSANSINRWYLICFLYFAITCTTLFVTTDWATGVFTELHQSFAVDRYVIHGLNQSFIPPNTAGVDSNYWGHIYQSASSKEIAKVLQVAPDMVYLRNNTICFIDVSDSILTYRHNVYGSAHLLENGNLMMEEFKSQLLDPTSPLRTETAVGKAIANNVAESALNVTLNGIESRNRPPRWDKTHNYEDSLDSSFIVIGATYYSYRTTLEKFPGELLGTRYKQSEFNFDGIDDVFQLFETLIVGVVCACVFVIAGLLAMLLMGRPICKCVQPPIVLQKEAEELIKFCGIHVIKHPGNLLAVVVGYLAVFSLFVGLVLGAVRGTFDFEINWKNDPPQLYLEFRPMVYTIFYVSVLCNLYLAATCCA